MINGISSLDINSNIIIFSCISILAVLITIILILYCKKNENNILNKLKLITIIIFIMSIVINTNLIKIRSDALKRGCEDLQEYNINELIETSEKTPIEDNIDDFKEGIIVFYRYGCPDCQKVHSLIEESFPDAKYISTRSKTGKKLLEKYPIESVPSAVYIDKNGTYTIEKLTVEVNGITRFNQRGAINLKLLSKE